MDSVIDVMALAIHQYAADYRAKYGATQIPKPFDLALAAWTALRREGYKVIRMGPREFARQKARRAS